jgi:DNA-binding transcriptional ArsR family regulator
MPRKSHAEALAALADPTRLSIYEDLRRGPRAVGELAEGRPVSRPAVSQHLKVLKGAGLVTERRVGTKRVYSVEVDGLVELRHYLDGLWEDALSAFRAEAEREKGRRRRTKR